MYCTLYMYFAAILLVLSCGLLCFPSTMGGTHAGGGATAASARNSFSTSAFLSCTTYLPFHGSEERPCKGMKQALSEQGWKWARKVRYDQGEKGRIKRERMFLLSSCLTGCVWHLALNKCPRMILSNDIIRRCQ